MWSLASAFVRRVLVGDAIAPEHEGLFRYELDDVNRRRLRILVPLMSFVHLVHIALFWRSPSMHLALLAHIAMLPVTFGVFLTLRFGRAGSARIAGIFVATAYLVHGAAAAGADQLTVASVAAFDGYCLAVAVIFSLTPRAAVVVYAVALAAFSAFMIQFSPSAAARQSNLLHGMSIVMVSVTLAWLLFAARRREFAQRRTIDRQRDQLAQLNASLERRVGDQVAEIVTRAQEVERLNAQLQAQVRDRSAELSLALAKLAKQRDVDGTLRPGVVLAGRFEILRLLGEGGMGAVYAGVDLEAGGPVAIKVIQATSSQQLDALRRFLREADTAASVRHPAVVRMLHVDVSDDGLLFQVQELVEGETLADRLRSATWPPGFVARLGSVLCDALAAAHAAGIVHRDVKPANLMLTRGAPGMKLLDFGIAKLHDAVLAAGSTTGERDGPTRTGIVVGTPAFMAPEQVDGTPVTDRTDVYSVGVLLYLLLSGRYPFAGDTPREIMMRHVVADVPDVRAGARDIPEALATLVDRCLQKEPAKRIDARRLAQMLGEYADREGVPSLEKVVTELRALPSVDAREAGSEIGATVVDDRSLTMEKLSTAAADRSRSA
jgi:eukaryotic-like serine/threonine-protein kinase